MNPLIEREFIRHGGDLASRMIDHNDFSFEQEVKETPFMRKGIKVIDGLRLSEVKQKLCFPESRGGKGWTSAKADEVELLYKQFLKDCLTTSKELSPSPDVDEMWHTHILFMRKYESDCYGIFGHILYYEPNMSDKPTGNC